MFETVVQNGAIESVKKISRRGYEFSVGNSRLKEFAFTLGSVFFGCQLHCQGVARLESQERTVHENQLCKYTC